MNLDDLAFLKTKVALLADFSDPEREKIAQGSRIAEYEPGAVIARAGDEVHFLGVVLEGKIAASVPTADDDQLLGQFVAGDTFGEMALMSGDPAIADLVAETRCRVMLVPLTLFQSRIMAEPRAVQRISRTISERFLQVMRDPAKVAATTRQEDVASSLALKSERPECILVLNCGSSSLKYSFFDTEHPENDARGHVERIGASGTRLAQRGPQGNYCVTCHREVMRRRCGHARSTHGQGRGGDPRGLGHQRGGASGRSWRGEVRGRGAD